MNDLSINTLDHVRQFLNGVEAMELHIEAKAARYTWIQTMLLRFHYPQLGKAEKGLLLDFLQTDLPPRFGRVVGSNLLMSLNN